MESIPGRERVETLVSTEPFRSIESLREGASDAPPRIGPARAWGLLNLAPIPCSLLVKLSSVLLDI